MEHRAAAGGDDRAEGAAELAHGLALVRAEHGFALHCDDLLGRIAGVLLDIGVRIEHLAAERLAERLRHGGFAAAGHADEDDVHRLALHEVDGVLERAGRRLFAGEDLTRADGLRREHHHAVRAGDAEFFRLQQKLRAHGIIDEIDDGAAAREAQQINDRLAVVRVHADRRGVHDELGVRVAGEVGVIVLPIAGDDDDLARLLLFERVHHRGGSAAAAEHEHLFRARREHRAAQQLFKAVDVRIVAVERSVGAADDRIDAADGARRFGELVANRRGALFVGDRDVQRVKIALPKEGLHILRFGLIELILIVAEHGMDGRRIAVAELLSEKSAMHHVKLPHYSFQDRCIPR